MSKEFLCAIVGNISNFYSLSPCEDSEYMKCFNSDIFDNANIAICIVNTDLKILAISNEFLRLTGGNVKKEKAINNNILKVCSSLRGVNSELEYKNVFETGETFISEEEIQCYGNTVYISTSKIPIKDEKGQVKRVFTLIKDISEPKELKEEIKCLQEESTSNLSKIKELYSVQDNFLSNISHELRTPLTSIIGYTEIMLDEKLTEKQRHAIEVIFKNSKRLSRLVENILDSHLIESTNLKLSDEAIIINEIIAIVVEDMKNVAKIKNLLVKLDLTDKLIVNGDIEKLTRVFSNILNNAIKFTFAGNINIKGRIEDQNVHIQIIDTGIGIPQDMLEKIFDRFYDTGSSRVRKYEGTGLGLWTSKNIIEAHGGLIWAESGNSGSTFHILLPRSIKP